MKRLKAACFPAVTVLALFGCAQTGAPIPKLGADSVHQTVELGRSVRGRPIEGVVFPGREPSVFVLGGIHGSEPSSADLVEDLVDLLIEQPELRQGRMVLVLPRANPDGLATFERHNANNVDLNRNFEAENFKSGGTGGQTPLSEPESRLLVEVLRRYRPSCVISVHAPLNCIDPDGGAASTRLAEQMTVGGLPIKDLEAMPGSMGTYVGIELGLAMVTYELDRKAVPAEKREEYLKPHLQALIVAIQKG